MKTKGYTTETTLPKWLTGIMMLIVLGIMAGSTATAGAPEYMKIKPAVGMALEIKGKWDSSGVFVARDIEVLPKTRRPKLRGEIQSVNAGHKSITLFGVEIEVTETTTFLEDGGDKASFDDLRRGQRIEVSCKVNKDGRWKARKIQTHGVKRSDKLKGTITHASVDGHAPDTIQISGLAILLLRETDVDDKSSHFHQSEDKLFGDLSRSEAAELNSGYIVEDRFIFDGQYRQQFRSERDFDLDSLQDLDETNTQPDIRLEATAFWSKSVRSHAQLRIRKRYNISGNQNQTSGPSEIEFTQLNVLFKDFGVKGFALQIGRQDFEEQREWLFDEYLDAIRAYYYGVDGWIIEGAVISAVNPIKPKFETWTDYFGRATWLLDTENEVSAYFLLRRDTGNRKRQPVWWGLSYYGHPSSSLKSWADLAIMKGEDKGNSLNAYAIDIGATFLAQYATLSPSVTAAYAIGSGDKSGDADDQRFRQTAYQDNVDKFGGATSVVYYGSVLSPELSNLKIFTLGLGIRPSAKSSVELVYHSYKQHRPENEIKGSDLLTSTGQPDGVESNIGWGLDLVTAFPKLWGHVRVTWTSGFFNPGPAFSPFQENALLNKINVNVGF